MVFLLEKSLTLRIPTIADFIPSLFPLIVISAVKVRLTGLTI